MFAQYFTNIMKQTARTGIPQGISNFSDDPFEKLTAEQRKTIETRANPLKIYEEFLQQLKDNKGNIEFMTTYIKEQEASIGPFRELLGADHALSKMYAEQFAQMNAILAYLPQFQ